MRISDWSSDVCSSDLERDLPHRGKVTIVGGIEDFPQRIEEGALSGSLVDDLLDCHLSPDFALDRDGTVDRHGLLAVQKLLPVDPIFGFALPKAGVSENNRHGRKRPEAFLVNEGKVTVRLHCPHPERLEAHVLPP